MTVNEVIKHVIPILEGIKVPMAEIEAIGVPVAGVIRDLKQCVAFMDHIEQEQREKAEREAAEKAADEEAAAAAATEEETGAAAQGDPEAETEAADAKPVDDADDLFGEKEQEGGEEK